MLPIDPVDQKILAVGALRESRIAQLLNINAAQLHKLQDEEIVRLRKEVLSYCDERLASLSSILQKQLRVRQILALPYGQVYQSPFAYILELIEQIAEIKDQRTNIRGKIYQLQLRRMIRRMQQEKQKQLKSNKFFSFFKGKKENKNQADLQKSEDYERICLFTRQSQRSGHSRPQTCNIPKYRKYD